MDALRLVRWASLAVATTVLAACTSGAQPAGPRSTTSTPEVRSSGTSRAPAPTGSAATLLATLPVKGRAPHTGYARERFGDAWTDDNDAPLGHNGCDTRNDVLGRDLHAVRYRPGTGDCVVLAGVLSDPYTGRTIDFTRGERTSDAVQIDHVVALSDAWQKGAQQLGATDRIDLGNDPLNLLAVDGPTNQAKGDGDAATWLPPRRSYRCAYVARQVAVKARYHLWVTAAERDAIVRVLRSCPGQPAPTEARPTSTHTPPMAPTPPSVSSTSVGFSNCSEARAAGAAPLHRGDPGYSARLDRDGDGIACEG